MIRGLVQLDPGPFPGVRLQDLEALGVTGIAPVKLTQSAHVTAPAVDQFLPSMEVSQGQVLAELVKFVLTNGPLGPGGQPWNGLTDQGSWNADVGQQDLGVCYA